VGHNYFGQTNVPPGLSGVTAIAAGGAHNVVLKSDGTIVAWDGMRTSNDCSARLERVTAIAAGDYHTMVMKSVRRLGRVGLNLYGQTDVPLGLSDVTSIGDFCYDSVALVRHRTSNHQHFPQEIILPSLARFADRLSRLISPEFATANSWANVAAIFQTNGNFISTDLPSPAPKISSRLVTRKTA